MYSYQGHSDHTETTDTKLRLSFIQSKEALQCGMQINWSGLFGGSLAKN